MKCCVEVNGLKIHAFHGVMPEERVTGNLYTVDLSVEYPFEEAMMSDNLNGTINYASLCDIIRQEMTVPSDLLEHVAGRIISSLRKEFPKCRSGKIRIAKTVPPIDAVLDSCAVSVEW
ncbi:MAG: dihydroneopterin aldolase [Duncaniella sp.]|nr:dihydroneopterin aldolase [Duncaniella sp.]